MRKTGSFYFDFAGSYVFGGVIIGALYWFLQAFLDAYIFGNGDLIGQLFSPNSYNIWMRTMVVSLLVFASAYVQSVVSRRKGAEQILKEENSFKQSLIKNAAEGLCVCHEIPNPPYNRFTVWNDRMTEITGYTMEEINRKGWYQSVYPDPEIRKMAAARMDKMRTGDNLKNEEWEITRSDGNKRVVAISTSILKSGDGNIHVLAMMNDITERVKAIETLRKNEAQTRALLDAIPDSIFHLSKDGVFLRYKGDKMTLYMEEEKFIGKKLSETLPENVSEIAYKHLALALKTGQPQIFEYELMINNSLQKFEARICVCNKDEVIAIVRDVTSKKTEDRQLQDMSINI